jgi:hypothetical protein
MSPSRQDVFVKIFREDSTLLIEEHLKYDDEQRLFFQRKIKVFARSKKLRLILIDTANWTMEADIKMKKNRENIIISYFYEQRDSSNEYWYNVSSKEEPVYYNDSIFRKEELLIEVTNDDYIPGNY